MINIATINLYLLAVYQLGAVPIVEPDHWTCSCRFLSSSQFNSMILYIQIEHNKILSTINYFTFIIQISFIAWLFSNNFYNLIQIFNLFSITIQIYCQLLFKFFLNQKKDDLFNVNIKLLPLINLEFNGVFWDVMLIDSWFMLFHGVE